MKTSIRSLGLAGAVLFAFTLAAQATIFWAEFNGSGSGWIGTANDDGSGVNRSLVTGQNYAKQVVYNGADMRLYFAGQFGIRSSKLDGTDVQFVRTWPDSMSGGLSVDGGAGMLYWQNGEPAISRGTIAGGAAVNIVTGRTNVRGTALDLVNGKIYWVDMQGGNGGVFRANLDGSSIETLIAGGQGWIKDIALDVANGKMYWTYNGGVRRANLSGSTIEQVVADGSDGWAIALDLANGNAYTTSGGGPNSAIRKILNFRAASPTWSTLVTGSDYITGIVYVPPPPSLALVSSANVTCNGAGDGSITVSASGGAGSPYTYSKDGVTYGASGSFTGLAPGTYSITAKDKDGMPSSAQVVTLTQPAVVAVTLNAQVNVSCNGDSDGSITVNTATGGSGAGYTYNIDGGAYGASATFNGLAAGAHTILAKDGNGCVSAGLVVTLTQPAAAVSGAIAKKLTLEGSTGSIQWQKSADGNTWNDIPGETSATLDVGALFAATPYFRAKVTTGVACSVYSSKARVTDTVFSGSVFLFQ